MLDGVHIDVRIGANAHGYSSLYWEGITTRPVQVLILTNTGLDTSYHAAAMRRVSAIGGTQVVQAQEVIVIIPGIIIDIEPTLFGGPAKKVARIFPG
jgi:hypothetical protein